MKEKVEQLKELTAYFVGLSPEEYLDKHLHVKSRKLENKEQATAMKEVVIHHLERAVERLETHLSNLPPE